MILSIPTARIAVTRGVAKAGFLLRKFAPEILTSVGIIAGGAAIVSTAKSSVELRETIAPRLEYIDWVKACENPTKKDLTLAYVSLGQSVIRLYAPTFAYSALSVTCIVSAHGLLRQRNAALLAAYTALDTQFKKYRDRVREDLGPEKEEEIYRGHRYVKDGDDVVTYKEPAQVSVYARFFDQLCPEWSKTPEVNMLFLRARQNYANDLLKARGHVFLNEVYAMLGIPHSQAGSVVGWLLDGDGDGYIDFGMYDGEKMHRMFVNTAEASILLDFNVDGVIWDKI